MAHSNMAFSSDECDNTDSIDTTEAYYSSSNSTIVNPKPSGCFSFVDFCPEYRRKPDSWFFQADYETFSDLFHKINEWLKTNPKWEVKTCETLIYDSTTGFGQTSPFFTGRIIKRNLRGVRLWISPRLHQRCPPQRIGCINVVPRIKSRALTDNGTNIVDNTRENTSSLPLSLTAQQLPIFETLDEMLVRVNELLATNPINGKILNVETVPIPIETNNWSIDTECSFWSDDYQRKNHTVFIIRIYFEYGTNCREQLEIVDFVPQCSIWDAPLAVPNFESFSSLLTRASQWLRDQPPGLRFCSCQTVEVPLDYAFATESVNALTKTCISNNIIESRCMLYPQQYNSNKQSSSSEFALKFLRLAYTKPQQLCPESHFPPTRDIVILNCKIFVPTKLSVLTGNSNNSNEPDYESINITKKKMEAWLMTTGAKILSAETAIITVPFSSSSVAAAVDTCLRTNSSVLGHYLVVYRVYLNGHYLEPPARLLPSHFPSEYDENQNETCSVM